MKSEFEELVEGLFADIFLAEGAVLVSRKSAPDSGELYYEFRSFRLVAYCSLRNGEVNAMVAPKGTIDATSRDSGWRYYLSSYDPSLRGMSIEELAEVTAQMDRSWEGQLSYLGDTLVANLEAIRTDLVAA